MRKPAADLEVRRVQTLEDFAQYHALRTSVYVAEGFLTPDELNGSVDRDEFDQHSIHGAVFAGNGEVVGTTRLILGTSCSLPVESTFAIDVPPRSAEASRFLVRKDFRRTSAMAMLIDWTLAQAVEQGIEHMYATVESFLFRMLNEMGLGFTQVTDPVWTYHSENFVIHAPIAGMLPSVEARDATRLVAVAPLLHRFRGAMLAGAFEADAMTDA